jgi:hypothetical protein
MAKTRMSVCVQLERCRCRDKTDFLSTRIVVGVAVLAQRRDCRLGPWERWNLSGLGASCYIAAVLGAMKSAEGVPIGEANAEA